MNRVTTAAAIAGIAVSLLGAPVAAANNASAVPPPTPQPLGDPVTSGPVTAMLVDAHHSAAAAELVVIIEFTTTDNVTPNGYSAVYVGPDGQQVEAFESIEPQEVFPGATALIVIAFAAATPGGSVMLSAYDADYSEIDLAIPVPAN